MKNHFLCFLQSYEVHLAANISIGEMVEFQEIGVVCHSVPIERNINVRKDIVALLKLRKLFVTEKYDSVHSVTPKAGLLTSMAGWLAHVPHRLHIFTGQVWATRKGFFRLFLKSMDKIIAFFDTNILVDGNSQRQFLINEGILKETNSFVPASGSISGVRLDSFVISEEIRVMERAKLKVADNKVVYVFLGRLNHDKGVGELFEAYNRFVIECPDSVLLLYGVDEGDYDKRVKDYPNIKRDENYIYHGVTRQPYFALQAADVFVLPTWREGFGLSVIEAQALSLPVITSDAYGVVDASVEGITGLRCGVNDPDGLFKCMKCYYEDSEMRKKHGLAGRERVKKLFSSSVVSKAWLEYYDAMFQET